MQAAFLGSVSALAFIACVVSPVARATSFMPTPFPKTVGEAPEIVRGKIGTSYADWGRNSEGGKQIYTYTELAIEEVFKGDISGKSLIMRELGGTRDGIAMEVAGTARFNEGEDVVVFLGQKADDGSYGVWGLMMGRYSIEQAPDGTSVLVGPGIQGQDGPHGDGRVTLDYLRQIVREQSKPGVKPIPSKAPSEAPRLQRLAPEPVVPEAGQPQATGVFWLDRRLLALGALVALLSIMRAWSRRARKKSQL